MRITVLFSIATLVLVCTTYAQHRPNPPYTLESSIFQGRPYKFVYSYQPTPGVWTLDSVQSTINVNFSDTTVFSNTLHSFLFGWQWGGGINKAVEKRLRTNCPMNTFGWRPNQDSIDLSAQDVDLGDVQYKIWQYVPFTREPSSNPYAYAAGMEWNTCAPTWGDQSPFNKVPGDKNGTIWFFGTKIDSCCVKDSSSSEFMRYTLRPSVIDPGLTSKIVADGSAYSNLCCRLDDTVTPMADTSRALANAALYNANKCYLVVNVKRIAGDTLPTDTVLAISIISYRRILTGSSTIVDSRQLVFDSIPRHLLSDTIRTTRGVTLKNMQYSGVDSVLYITRAELPSVTAADSLKDVAITAYFRLVDPLSPEFSTLHNPWFQSRFANSPGDMDSFHIQVRYFGGASVSVGSIGVYSPRLKDMLFGYADTLIAERASLAIWNFKKYQNAIPQMGRNIRLLSFYGSDETPACLWRANRYLAQLLDKRLVTEGPASDAYKHHVPQSAYWSGYDASGNYQQRVPFVKAVWDGVNRVPFSFIGGWLGDPSGRSPKIYEFDSCKCSKYPWVSATLPFTGLSENTNATLCALEEIAAARYRDYDVMYGNEPWFGQVWIESLWSYRLKYDPALSINVPRLINGHKRPKTGEEVRRATMYDIVMGAKGLFYDRLWNEQYGIYDKNDTDPTNNQLMMHPFSVDSMIAHSDYREFKFQTGALFPVGFADSLALDPTGTSYLLTDSVGSDYFHDTPKNNFMQWIRRGNVAAGQHVDSSRVYFGLRSTRRVLMQVHDIVSSASKEFVDMHLLAWSGKGFNWFRSSKYRDTTLYTRYVNLQWGAVKTRVASPGAVDEQWSDTTTFVDVTVHASTGTSSDSLFYVGVLNRHANPLVDIAPSEPDSSRYAFYSTCEFDSLVQLGVLDKYCQLGSRQIQIPFSYKPPVYDQQGRMLHVQEMVADTSIPHVDTLICANCTLSSNYLPGEGKMFRVTVLKPKDAYVSAGSLDFSNQRKIIAMPVLDSVDVVNHRGIYDSTRVRYHIVYHRVDTLITGLHDTLIVPRVYYKRSHVIDRCTPQDVNPLDPNISDLWDVTRCLSDSLREFRPGCLGDTALYNNPCKYPSLVVRFDSVDNEEYVYVVFNCQDPYPTHPKHSFVAEAQFVSHGNVVNHATRVVSRFGWLGTDNIDSYGHASINASRLHNFYAWSSAENGINVAARLPSLNDSARCPYSGQWYFSNVSWNTLRADPSDNGADCRHPALNTYARMECEDSCALVWEERRVHTDTSRPYDDWHIYYTHLSIRAGILKHSLPPYKGPDPAVLDTNSDGSITRISKWITNRRGFSEHHLPSVARNLTVREHSWRADLISWAGESAYSYVCGPTPSNAHAVFLLPMWADRDSLFCVGNHAIWSCVLGLNKPSLTWSTSFTQDSDVVFDFTCPPDGWVYGSDMIFNFGKRYWSFTAPMNIIEGGTNPHLSAQPIIGTNLQWKQQRRLFNGPTSVTNPSINSSVKGLFKPSTGESPYTAYPLVGFENSSGLFTLCDLIDDGRVSTMHALFHDLEQRRYSPSDTVYSDWFAVNDKKSLHFVMNGNYTDIAMMFLENRRTGVSTYVDLDQIVVDSSREVHTGRFDVLNGGGDDYKILLTKRDTSAQYVENVYIDNRLPYYGKSAASNESTSGYEVDLGKASGLSDKQQLAVYPIPAEGDFFVAIAHQSRQNEHIGNVMQVVVTNAVGDIVMRVETKGGETLKLSSTSFAPGMYNVYLIDPIDHGSSETKSSAKFIVR